MTEVTEEARAELIALENAGLVFSHHNAQRVMLALDRHHGRTPPDPMVAKAERIYEAIRYYGIKANAINALAAALKKEFPDG